MKREMKKEKRKTYAVVFHGFVGTEDDYHATPIGSVIYRTRIEKYGDGESELWYLVPPAKICQKMHNANSSKIKGKEAQFFRTCDIIGFGKRLPTKEEVETLLILNKL